MAAHEFTPWLACYREHLVVLNYAPGTLIQHDFYLRRFVAYLREFGIAEITAITPDTIREYQTHLAQALNAKGYPNSVLTQNNALHVVKAFFRFLCEYDYLPGNPAKTISYAKRPTRLPRSILTRTEMRKLLHAPDTTTILGYRDRTMLEVLYSSGIRKSELGSLVLHDVDTTEGILRINAGKGNKDRVVPIGAIACRYLHNYITAVRSSLIRDPYNQHLFLSITGRRLAKNVVWEVVKRYAKKARTPKRVSPHTFRHTCATLMLRNKANIRHLQEMLGHTSLTSTQVYTAVTITDLQAVHRQCHPRERDTD